MTDEHASELNTDVSEQDPETRMVKQLNRAGYVGFLKGSDGSAIAQELTV